MPITENQTPGIAALVPEIARVEAAFRLLPRNVFVVADNAPVIATELGIPTETVIEILQNPNPALYVDVPPGLQRISDAGSLPVVWTQGHLDEDVQFDALTQTSDLSFQSLKVVRSGLHTHLQRFGDRLFEIGIPGIFGGFDKCDPNVVLPILDTARQRGIERIVAVDDLGENLIRMGELSRILNIPYTPVLINRILDKEQTGIIRSFDELRIFRNALYLLDLDRTQIDTDAMKDDLYLRLAERLSF